ncbi:unnamed protein product [marine sediment metagenome]|uniref:Gfo/Idh/MocA-like oxidoreductase N-terminal domain-containing protein n=1 Tax=marine sediment metagenome TaxID=412755 RepID=X0T9M6_9ZZZZ
MDDAILGVAIHGAGKVAYAHAASWMKNPHCRIVSVSSRRKSSAQRLVDELGINCAVRDDYREVLADDRVDVVNLSGPNHVHAEQGIAAARAGKHILIEKPMVISMEENRALRNAVAKAGVKSVVSFVLRWHPLFENLKSLLAGGAIGELFYVEIDYWHGISPSWHSGWEWVHTKKTGGSTMLLGGCHAVDAIRYLSGEEVVEVTAYSNNKKGLFEYDANVVAVLKFAGGAIGKTSALFDAEMPYSFNIDLAGTEGAMRDNRLWSKKLFPGQTGWTPMATLLPDSGDVHHHPFDAEMDHLVDCIREDRESHCNIADGYRTHELCLAIDQSIERGGRPVSLPLE